jgi:creatinine amidohydrolase
VASAPRDYIPPVARWASLTMDEVGEAASAGAIAVLPVGATEQHGAHLPTGTDTMLADHVAEAAAERTGDVVLPALPYGCSLGHTDRWPGTISLHPTTMIAALVELGRWAHASGFRKLVIVNGHATNGPPCQSAILQLRHELPDLRARFVSIFDLTPEIAARYTEDAPDFHANEAETSMLLQLDESHVRPDRIVDEPDRTVGRVLTYPMPAVTRSGVVGAPSTASAERGAKLVGQLVEALTDLLKRARAERDPER